MAAQRSLGGKTKSPRKFDLVSCFELKMNYVIGLILGGNDVISVHSSISFEALRVRNVGMLKNKYDLTLRDSETLKLSSYIKKIQIRIHFLRFSHP